MASTSTYPTTLDGDLHALVPGGTTPAGFSDFLSLLGDAVTKMESELGLNPSGTFSTVVARLAKLGPTGFLTAALAKSANVSLTTPQSIPNATETQIIWDTHDFTADPTRYDLGTFDGGAGGSLEITEAGIYLVAAELTYAANATGSRGLRFRATKTTAVAGLFDIDEHQAVSADAHALWGKMQAAPRLIAVVTDRVPFSLAVYAKQNSTGALNVTTGKITATNLLDL